MIRITNEVAMNTLKNKGLEAYNALMTLKNHPDAVVYADDAMKPSSLIVIDGYWVVPVDTTMETVLKVMRIEGYDGFGLTGVQLKYFDEAKSLGCEIDWHNFCHVYAYKNERPSVDVMDGFEIGALSLEDAAMIDEYYTYKNEYSLMQIEEAITERPTIGIRTPEGELASWVLVHPDGTMGIMYTKERFRQLGLGRVATNALINKQLDLGMIPYVHVVHGNEASVSLTQKVGMEHVMEVVWFGIEL